MKNVFLTAAAMMMLIGAVSLAPAAPASAAASLIDDSGTDHHRIRLRGVIVEVNRHGIVLRTRHHDRDIPIRVVDRTRIFLNGEPAHLGDLMPRDRAVVRALRTDRGLVARSIRARRGDG